MTENNTNFFGRPRKTDNRNTPQTEKPASKVRVPWSKAKNSDNSSVGGSHAATSRPAQSNQRANNSRNSERRQFNNRDRQNSNNQPKLDSSPSLKVIPLGGLDGIGKNMTVFELPDSMLVIDAGLMFPDDDHPGVDLILPDYNYIIKNQHKLAGIIITHGHEDHIGALPYLLKDLKNRPKLYSTDLTLGMIEGKIAEHRLKKDNFIVVKDGQREKIGGFDVSFFSVTHSIPAALGIYLSTKYGSVMHTGDFKLDQTPIDGRLTNYEAIVSHGKRGVDLLLGDSTNANIPGFTASEASVGADLLRIIKDSKQKVIVASFSSHIHRVQQVCDAAKLAGRRVAVTGRSMLTNTEVAKKLSYLKIDDRDLIDSYKIKDIADDKLVVMCTGSQGEPLSALARMANGDHQTMSINPGDTVIISATPVPGNEKAVTRVINALSKIGAHVYSKANSHVHVSGHGSQEELKLMLNLVRPKHFMPVHGEAQHLQAHARLAKSIGLKDNQIHRIEEGQSLEVRHAEVKRGANVPTGVLFVDGLTVGDKDAVVLKDRQTLAQDGIVFVICQLRASDSSPVGSPEIVMRGISAANEQALKSMIVQTVEGTISSSAIERKKDPNRLKRNIREQLSTLFWQKAKIRPLVIPTVLEV